MSGAKEIIKSPHDHRQYQYLVLDNNLSVLLVEDSSASQAAVSMAINVGHFDDPISRPGMAHFLEHMLFLGTEKFPEPGEFHAFINQHGGSNNAWTGTEYTNFFFSIDAHFIEESLDRFSQFFIAPLFHKDLVDRERHAIESEFSLKLKDDIRRTYQVQKETVNPAHPFSKFSVGNLKTLSGDQGILREELLRFYHHHYSANVMTLCIVAPSPLKDLEHLATHFFSPIIDKQWQKKYPDVPIYQVEQLQTHINIIPMKDQKRVAITFSLPQIYSYYKHKPLTFISHLLGYEGHGSLLSYLKNNGYAINLSAGGGVNGYNFKDYNISIQLTDKGVIALDTVIDCAFEYIELIKTQAMQDWRYQEQANLSKLAFKYQEHIKPVDLASHLSINMHHYDVEDLILGDYKMDGLHVPQTMKLLNLMTPSNMRIQLISAELETNSQTAWYHAPYQIQALPMDKLTRWKQVNIRSELALPNKNPFIIKDAIARSQSSQTNMPIIISQHHGYRIWHQKDDEFNLPKGHIYLSIDSIEAASSARKATLTRLYVEMLLDHLIEHTYQAEVAGLSYNIYPHQGGITLHLTGFSGKQKILLALLIKKARTPYFSQERLTLIKRQLLRAWYNHTQAKPISQLFTGLTVSLQRRSYEPSTMADELTTITLNELHDHIRQFYQETHLEGLIYGDWLASEASILAKNLKNIVSLISSPCQGAERELVSLSGKGTLMRQIPAQHQDSGIIVYYQADTSTPAMMAIFSLLNHSMSSAFFHELRTKKQLGYMLGTGYFPLNRYPGMIFYIQSPLSGPLQLLEAIDEFIADFNYTILQLTHEQWTLTKQGLMNQIMEHDPNLTTRGQRYWSSIGNKDYDFNQRKLVVTEIEKLTREDLIKLMMKKMRHKHRDRLVLFSTGEHHKNLPPLTSENMITDLNIFKDTQ
ncbi:insulinase family protein [Shewanella sp. VB17]|uniref:insulinase family protein n=1 Tax=Shewanella sp. VB17 TaxID=2739432 RepID=UPI001563362B|nr:insulinase family protein [Shewanella sp. VB17]NRD74373.1 insulinase family protein [Shewanella sp. VB17]